MSETVTLPTGETVPVSTPPDVPGLKIVAWVDMPAWAAEAFRRWHIGGQHQDPGLGLIQDGGVVGEDLACDLLGVRYAIAIADAHDEILAAVGVAGVVVDRALVDRGVGDLDVVAILGHEDRGAGRQPLHKPHDAANLYQVAGLERGLHAEENTGQKVLGDVLKGNPQDQA